MARAIGGCAWLAMGLLAAMPLTIEQLVVASAVLSMFFPCIATFIVLLRELGIKDTIKATCAMVISALLGCSLLNLIL